MNLRQLQYAFVQFPYVMVGLMFTVQLLVGSQPGLAAETTMTEQIADALRKVSPEVLSAEQRKQASGMVERDIRRRTDAANARNRAEWSQIKNRQQWETYRDARLQKLRKSLGQFPQPAKTPDVRVTGVVKGDGFQIENLLYESRPGQWVTGNLYVPAKPSKSMPGIMIAHAHHRPKTQGEMQDMGMTWARAGCLVLVIDQVGYGERRAHPFHGKQDYDKQYRWWRQDYYFRYDSGIQLQLAGDSLMGWMVWDLMRGVDLLLARPGIDSNRIILLGAVAGGGDPCGVTAALDRRIAAAVPFNFGGPQPESRYPLPDDAETSFNYLGGSYWESTRGLRRGGVDGFAHWVIVAGIAPRRLIHAHEFAWDKQRDPVWKRYQKIYGDFYGVSQNLAYAHGKGLLRGRSSEASHCTNIGKFHRRMIHPVFKRWFGVNVTTETEYSSRRDPEELTCMTPKARRELMPKALIQLVSKLGVKRSTAARRRLAGKSAVRRKRLRDDWARLLGNVKPKQAPKLKHAEIVDRELLNIERIVLEVETDMIVPALVLSGTKRQAAKSPVVVAVAQSGKQAFVKQRSQELAQLVAAGVIVCLPDLRGTGETKAGTGRGRTSGDGNRSVNMLLFGETMLGQRLRDLRMTIAHLRGRKDVDGNRIMLWGDSFVAANDGRTNFKVPRGVDGRPKQSEPIGGLLALLGALFEDDIRAVYVHGGLSGFQSVLATPHVYIPHDVVVPGVLTAGDLCDVAAALAPRPLRLEGTVDGLNRYMSERDVQTVYEPAIKSCRDMQTPSRISIGRARTSAARWILARL